MNSVVNKDTDILFFVEMMANRSIIIDTSWRCVLACPLCPRTIFPNSVEKAKKSYGDLRIEDYKKLLLFFKYITFCGSISDPIYHPKFHKLLELSNEKEKWIRIHTNGWGKKISWWKKTFELSLNDRIEWIFGLDGLPHQSHNYRVNQKGEEVFEVMKLGSSMGCNITWQWIIFGYNQNNIKEGFDLAIKYNINFLLRHSMRFEFAKLFLGKDLYDKLIPSLEFQGNVHPEKSFNYFQLDKFS